MVQIYRLSFPMLFHELALNVRQVHTKFALVYSPSDGTDRPIERLL